MGVELERITERGKSRAWAAYTFSSISASHTISATFSSMTKYQINCGGSASSPYTADQYFSGGTARTVTNTITTTGVTNPAPQAVYKAERYGAATATTSGQIVIKLTNVTDNATIEGIQIIRQ